MMIWKLLKTCKKCDLRAFCIALRVYYYKGQNYQMRYSKRAIKPNVINIE